jgi:unsaturated chondroitin disaccharide hydrolase
MVRSLNGPSMKTLSRPLIVLATFVICHVSVADPVLELLPKVFERAAQQNRVMLKNLADSQQFPRSLQPDGSLRVVDPEDWTSGFWPGTLWLIHEYDGSAEWKEHARAATARLEGLRHFKGHHDVGFMLGCSYGNALRLSPADADRAVLRDGAAALASRYRPALGLIRSWDFKPYAYPVIIDNLMNLELLSWSAKQGGDPKHLEIAIRHADVTLAQHFRADGSAYHILDYNPKTGGIRAIHAGQGGDVRSAWARGQAWAIYGYAMMFRETQKPEYLAQAATVADFVMKHPNLPADHVPYWDFGAPAGPETPRDASAAAVMAAGLLELASAKGKEGGEIYRQFARSQLLALGSPNYLAEVGENGGFLLMHSTGHIPEGHEIDSPLCYADYYFLEALLRYRAWATGKVRKSFGEVH